MIGPGEGEASIDRLGSPIEREVAAETLAAALGHGAARTVQRRLERLLLDDRELLISLQCQLEQIRRELRLFDDERLSATLEERGQGLRH